ALASHPLVGEVRVCGLVGAVELVADKATKQSFDPKLMLAAKAVAFMQEEGLISRAVAGDNIALCPPLIITEDEINIMFDRFTRGLDRAAETVLAHT
ncbi:MAG: aminotransferase class III-fold pyridoxal phosphate-dependent enzyme, partial [Sneathiella sp.]